MTPFLRWAGSKRQLLPALKDLIGNNFTRYVEPFAGSACVFFDVAPKKALLGDINSELINTYIEVKYRVGDVIECLRKWHKTKKQYLELRSVDPKSLPRCARAARFIYLNRCCFNGLYRTNREGTFNVPYGGNRSGRIPRPSILRLASSALKNAKLISGDFTKVIKKVELGDFVYMDPPFSTRSRRTFNEYDASLFGADAVNRLKTCMKALDKQKVRFVVSYAESEEAESLREGFCSLVVRVRRNIGGFASRRKFANEVFIYNS